MKFIIPKPAFNKPTSTVLVSADNQLMGARIAEDEQWRFPKLDTVPDKFKKCILAFEDKHFYKHLGINPVSVLRALKANLKHGRIKQGGSTLTMQVARLYEDGKARTYTQKLKEMLLSVHFELNYSKEEILNLYCTHAPFGGNVVGLETASWRYFGRAANHLTWSESAVLAVLPNAPSLIFPGKNEEMLRSKRNSLLVELRDLGHITEEEFQLAQLEALPRRPEPLPRIAPHLLDKAVSKNKGERVEVDILAALQSRSQEIINTYSDQYSFNEIYNASAVILETKTGKVLSYIGNSTNSKIHQNAVDVVYANRSTGSLLKPFLYAENLSSGEILPKMLLTDIPTFISGYSPENYHKTHDGAVPANEALYRSLNVPFVRLLREYGVDRFHKKLNALGMGTLKNNSGHYGLSLILGGAEGKLMELTSMYASLGRCLVNYDGETKNDHLNYFTSHWRSSEDVIYTSEKSTLSPAAIYDTFYALREVKRPLGEEGWRSFGGSRRVAWKTGTSFGSRDAWAIGCTPEYTIGVWVGNADGEGRSGLTGVGYAAPIMFDLFNELPQTTWFEKPYDEYREMHLCSESGHLASTSCSEIDTVLVTDTELKTGVCPYHKTVHLNGDKSFRVSQACYSGEIISEKWFELKPAQAWFYKLRSPTYKSLPPYLDGCAGKDEKVMEFIYPKFPNRIYIPKYLKGEQGRAVFELAHLKPGHKVYWYLDNNYLGLTVDLHQMEITALEGKHSILVVDEEGNELLKSFEVLSKG